MANQYKSIRERLASLRHRGVVSSSSLGTKCVVSAAVVLLCVAWFVGRIYQLIVTISNKPLGTIESLELGKLSHDLSGALLITCLLSIGAILLVTVLQTRFFLSFNASQWRATNKQSKIAGMQAVRSIISLLVLSVLSVGAVFVLGIPFLLRALWSNYPEGTAQVILSQFSPYMIGAAAVLALLGILFIFIKRFYTAYVIFGKMQGFRSRH